MNLENYDPSFPDQPVVDLYLPIWASLPAFFSKPAFIWSNDDAAKSSNILTYAQLNHSVHLISTQLLVNLVRGDTVIILCPPGLELVEIIFGCQRAGLLTIPIFPPDPSFTNENYHHFVRVLSQTKPKAAIADHHYSARIQQYIASSSSTNDKLTKLLQNLKWVSTFDLKNDVEATVLNIGSFSSSYDGCRPDEVYLIQYTSGATGIPKPVLVTAGSAAHNVRLARKAYKLQPNSVIVSWLPQYHDCGLQFLLLTVISGATCVLTSPVAFITRPSLWLELISDFKATCTPVPSFTLPLVVKRGEVQETNHQLNLQSLKNLIIINEPIYRASVEEFVTVFKQFGLNPSSISPSYGLAENCTFVSTSWRRVNNQNQNFATFPSHNKLLPCARLNSPKGHQDDDEDDEEDMDIIVVNEETNEPVIDGVEGEIWVSSPSNCSGYLCHPFLTQQIFQARLKNKVSKCYIRTGDRGIIKGEERYLYITGRCADVIRLSNGQEIHPHYIETAAHNSCPKLLRAGCLAAFKVSNNRVAVVAEMQRNEKSVNILKQICEGIREAVSKEERVEIGMVVLVKNGCAPKTTSGKIQRWIAKEKLNGGKMGIVMEMIFDNKNNSNNSNDSLLSSSRALDEANKSSNGEEGKRVIARGKDGIFPRLSTIATPPSLLSFL